MKLTRRNFLKSLGTAAAGAVLVGVGGKQPKPGKRPRYIAVLGWLEGSEYNNVILNEDAIRLTLWGLNGGALFDVPGKLRHSIGTVEVDGSAVYCYTDHDLSGKHPALEIIAHASALENGKMLVTSVKKCALFITDDDNGNAFYKVINA